MSGICPRPVMPALPWDPNSWGEGRKRRIGGCSSSGREERQGRGNVLTPGLRVFVTGWRSWISKQNASVRQGAGKFSLGNVKMKHFQREMSHCHHPHSPEPSRCWQCHPRGLGKGRGREGGQSPHPSIRSVSMGALTTLITGKIIPALFHLPRQERGCCEWEVPWDFISVIIVII